MNTQTIAVIRTRRVAPCFIVVLLIAAPALADPINLMWDPNQDAPAGYVVRVGAQPGAYTRQYDVGTATAFTYPDATAGQRYCFTVAAYASGGAEGPMSKEVCGYSDAPPVLVNPGNQATVAGNPVTLQLAGSDPYGQPVAYSAIGLPPGLTLAPSSGFISGAGTTPGSYAVTARVTDGRLSESQTFAWSIVAPPVGGPTIAIASPTSAATYAATRSPLTLQGTAASGAGVTEVRWMNDRAGAGIASGTANWSAGSIALQAGVNVLTVLVRDGGGNEAADILTVTYTIPTSTVVLSGRSYVQKGRKFVALTWAACPWPTVDIVRDGLPLTTTVNDGAYTDSMKKGGTYNYRLCETGNSANCSNSVAIIF